MIISLKDSLCGLALAAVLNLPHFPFLFCMSFECRVSVVLMLIPKFIQSYVQVLLLATVYLLCRLKCF